MSHPVPHIDTADGALKPQPRQRRTFDLSSAPNSAPPTPPPADPTAFMGDTVSPLNTTFGDGKPASLEDESDTPARTRSFLNLTGSTLFGIYQDTRIGTDTGYPTPAGTGAQTPNHNSRQGSFDFTRSSISSNTAFQNANGKVVRRPAAPQVQKHRAPRKGFRGFFVPLVARLTTLFGMGMLYGVVIGHLLDHRQIAPVKVDLDRTKWNYLATWGCIGALLGEALPWADELWTSDEEDEEVSHARQQKKLRSLEAWMDVVRSIGAFIGIAFAIRRLPWESTLQLSLTLALANPALWYLIDRSAPGFILSTVVAFSGTAVFLGTNPGLVPSPSSWQVFRPQDGVNTTVNVPDSGDLVFGIFSQESVGVSTWIASVLFVSAICFGNIGRRLVPQSA